MGIALPSMANLSKLLNNSMNALSSPKFSRIRFYCFTPWVSLTTFFIEFILAGYVIYRYKLNQFSRIMVLVLVLLGMFQLSEYIMCTATTDVLLWGKIGASSITILPVLCLHLVTMITRKSRWTQVGYIMGSSIVAAILFTPVLKSIGCTGNYVEVNFQDWFSIIFNGYYAIFLFIGIQMLVQTWWTNKGDKQALFWAMAT